MFDTSTRAKAAALAFEESPVAQLMTRYRRIVTINRALAGLFGFERNDLIGRSVQKLYPSTADFMRIGDQCEEVMRGGKSRYYEDERFMQASGGEVFWARAKGTTLTPDDPYELMIWSFEKIEGKPYRSVRLTAREKEIAPLIGSGMTSKQIGERLGISHRTVEVHRAKLMKKFNVHNTAELVSQIVVAV
ncbi:MAG: LuxR C-terminal-related transcriptional regulator [Heliomarina sp.]|uniref:LuxR C-terminal-related transcriptional regulator n=1 Tax=Heliomarina sp. TaxID=2917556 RepID=UPI004057E01A